MAMIIINAEEINKCLENDSISCIQRNLYRRAKEFFDNDNIELINGVTLVKSADSRNARSSKEVIYEQEINTANNVADRQHVLENFVGESAKDFLSGRSLKINFTPAIEKIGQSARAIVNSVPEEINEAVDVLVEGRGGKKKLLKTLAPLIVAAKAKVGILAALAFFAISFLAKKAIFASLISIAISGFLGLKSLWSKGGDVTAYNAGGFGSSSGWSAPSVPSSGWPSSGSTGWDEPHSSNSFTAQSQAFSGYRS